MQRERKYKDERLNEAVEELNRYRARQRQIIHLTAKLEEYRENYAVKSQDYERLRVAGGEYINKVAEIGVKWAELEVEIRRMQSEAELEMYPIQLALSPLSSMQRNVLEGYYIKGLTIVALSENFDYSPRQIKRLKREALINYAKFKRWHPHVP